MNWKPSEGLLRAESVVQTLLTDMATMGLHVTNPTLRYRMVQVVGQGIDQAIGQPAQSAPEPTPDWIKPNGSGRAATVQEALDQLQANDMVEMVEVVPAPAKRGRGRPKKKHRAKSAEAIPA